MADAVAEYDGHRQSPDSWALGRFVVPLSRWEELDAAVRQAPGDPWPVSLLASVADVERISALRAAGNERLVIEAVECRADTVAEAEGTAGLVRSGVDVFVELPLHHAALGELTAAVRRAGAAGKIRTGGVTAAAFPTTSQVIAFMRACRAAGLRFKATAGLHHAVRGEYRLTYDPTPPMGVMFGFLNIALTAALLWFGREEPTLLAALEEQDPAAIEFTDAGVSWRDERLTSNQLDEVRSEFFVGFGSCSFREPIAELGLEPEPRA